MIHIFSADHQRAAQVLAKNLHAERGETAENKHTASWDICCSCRTSVFSVCSLWFLLDSQCWEHVLFTHGSSVRGFSAFFVLKKCVCAFSGDVSGRDRGDPGCDWAVSVHPGSGAALQTDRSLYLQPSLPGDKILEWWIQKPHTLTALK